jgi:E3 ubiquitin-protein ligase RGLG
VRASHYPLSIITFGVGDGPWDEMHKYDDDMNKDPVLRNRVFDNFQFVDWCTELGDDDHLAVRALQELPAQFESIKEHELLDFVPGADVDPTNYVIRSHIELEPPIIAPSPVAAPPSYGEA